MPLKHTYDIKIASLKKMEERSANSKHSLNANNQLKLSCAYYCKAHSDGILQST